MRRSSRPRVPTRWARRGLAAVLVALQLGLTATLVPDVVPHESASPVPETTQTETAPAQSAARVEAPESTPSQECTDAPEPDPARGEPVRLVVPAIGVDARVVPIATGADDALVPPVDVSQVGWWSQGARPGSVRGTALVTGHTVSAGDGVFDDLGDLTEGDVIRLRTESGWLTYRVDEVSQYSKKRLARRAPELFDQSGEHRLVLVTCSGRHLGAYHDNTVVIAHAAKGGTAVG